MSKTKAATKRNIQSIFDTKDTNKTTFQSFLNEYANQIEQAAKKGKTFEKEATLQLQTVKIAAAVFSCEIEQFRNLLNILHVYLFLETPFEYRKTAYAVLLDIMAMFPVPSRVFVELSISALNLSSLGSKSQTFPCHKVPFAGITLVPTNQSNSNSTNETMELLDLFLHKTFTTNNIKSFTSTIQLLLHYCYPEFSKQYYDCYIPNTGFVNQTIPLSLHSAIFNTIITLPNDILSSVPISNFSSLLLTIYDVTLRFNPHDHTTTTPILQWFMDKFILANTPWTPLFDVPSSTHIITSIAFPLTASLATSSDPDAVTFLSTLLSLLRQIVDADIINELRVPATEMFLDTTVTIISAGCSDDPTRKIIDVVLTAWMNWRQHDDEGWEHFINKFDAVINNSTVCEEIAKKQQHLARLFIAGAYDSNVLNTVTSNTNVKRDVASLNWPPKKGVIAEKEVGLEPVCESWKIETLKWLWFQIHKIVVKMNTFVEVQLKELNCFLFAEQYAPLLTTNEHRIILHKDILPDLVAHIEDQPTLVCPAIASILLRSAPLYTADVYDHYFKLLSTHIINKEVATTTLPVIASNFGRSYPSNLSLIPTLLPLLNEFIDNDSSTLLYGLVGLPFVHSFPNILPTLSNYLVTHYSNTSLNLVALLFIHSLHQEKPFPLTTLLSGLCDASMSKHALALLSSISRTNISLETRLQVVEGILNRYQTCPSKGELFLTLLDYALNEQSFMKHITPTIAVRLIQALSVAVGAEIFIQSVLVSGNSKSEIGRLLECNDTCIVNVNVTDKIEIALKCAAGENIFTVESIYESTDLGLDKRPKEILPIQVKATSERPLDVEQRHKTKIDGILDDVVAFNWEIQPIEQQEVGLTLLRDYSLASPLDDSSFAINPEQQKPSNNEMDSLLSLKLETSSALTSLLTNHSLPTISQSLQTMPSNEEITSRLEKLSNTPIQARYTVSLHYLPKTPSKAFHSFINQLGYYIEDQLVYRTPLVEVQFVLDETKESQNNVAVVWVDDFYYSPLDLPKK
ncbi:hypothetical protein QTN25_001028 [Entamoeba marina]